MKLQKFKGFCLGVLITLLIEVCIFMYYTCNVQVSTKYLYNPDKVIEVLGQYQETIK